MNFSRAFLTLLFIFLMGGCSEPETRTFPSGDDAGMEAPPDFPLSESPEILVAREGISQEIAPG